jgi:uncharacterized CHY-type Zn-finger protein
MEAANTFETLVNFYQTTRRYNSEDSHLSYDVLTIICASCSEYTPNYSNANEVSCHILLNYCSLRDYLNDCGNCNLNISTSLC